MVKCPKCKHAEHPGYPKGKRCAVCKGWGIATESNALGWLDGCIFPKDN